MTPVPEGFPKVPYNTNRLFVMGTSYLGCEVYMPVVSDKLIESKKKELQDFLNAQEPLEDPPPLELA